MNIGFLTTGWNTDDKGQHWITGTSWQRCIQPAMFLHEFGGHNTVVAPAAYLGPSGIELIGWDDFTYGDLDVLIIQEWTNKNLLEIIEHAQQHGTKVIIDCDDLLWGLDPKHCAYEFHKPNPDQVMNSVHWLNGIRMADGITCASEYLYNDVKANYNEKAYLVRSAIEPLNFRWKKQRREDTHVGWHGALPWRSGDLEKLKPFMYDYLTKHNYRFRHIGYIQSAGSVHSRLGIPRSLLDEQPQVLTSLLPDFLPAIDIGIVPLKYCPFNYSKTFIKGLEYACTGIPFVAHATPEYKYLDTGIVARTQQDFLEGLERLADPKEWESVRNQQRIRVEDFNINKRWKDWEETYARVIGGR